MPIDEILERSTINLLRALDLEEAEKLIGHLAEKIPADIHYHILHHRSIFHSYDEGMRGEILKQDGTVEIDASIKSLEKPFAYDSFKFKSSDLDQDTSKLSVISFNLVPGWELSEYRPGIKELWDLVRKETEQYVK